MIVPVIIAVPARTIRAPWLRTTLVERYTSPTKFDEGTRSPRLPFLMRRRLRSSPRAKDADKVALTKKEPTHGTSIDYRPDVSQRDGAICMHNLDCHRHHQGDGNCGPNYSGNSDFSPDVCRWVLAPDGGMGNRGNGNG